MKIYTVKVIGLILLLLICSKKLTHSREGITMASAMVGCLLDDPLLAKCIELPKREICLDDIVENNSDKIFDELIIFSL